jgi:dipeptidyl aminopeptidase/acylaminoacyl peptidase
MKTEIALPAVLCVLAGSAVPACAAPRASARDLLAVKWVGKFALSPDGRNAAVAVKTANREANRQDTNLYLVALGEGSTPRPLTRGAGNRGAPAFSPDGKRLAFEGASSGEESQIFVMPAEGGEATRLTSLSTGASDPVWSPDGTWIAFTSSVYPDCADEACNAARLKARKESKVKARIYDALLMRHWKEWRGARRSHIFVVGSSGGAPRDLTPGPADAPPVALGGTPDYAFSPDAKTLAFVKNTDAVVATSTNNDVFEVGVEGGEARRVSSGPGNDHTPRYSPDGRYLAYFSMPRAGYESDRQRIVVRDRTSGAEVEWAKSFAGQPKRMAWGADSRSIYFTAPHRGHYEIFVARGDEVREVSHGLYAQKLAVSADGRRLFFTHESVTSPPELYRLDVDGKAPVPVTRFNEDLVRRLGWRPAEHHTFAGANGEPVHALLVKPPDFREGERYAAMVILHGGPQGMLGDDFHPRWNLGMFAASGFVVFGINFHGSTGFGQPFTDSIRDDWGGKPFEDALKGAEYLASLPFVRPKPMCAAGASYGGYLVNWIATHSDRFACLISHAGLFNLESKYGSTEELWFPEWEFKGTPWTNREGYRKWSPHSYAEKLKTPTLVVHGQNDMRVPVEQGLQMFTALQRQGIPSRFLYFPDEYHFVVKPQNVELWWKTVRDWLSRYLGETSH